MANRLLSLKYGKLKSGLDAIFSLRGAVWTVIVIDLTASSASEEVQ